MLYILTLQKLSQPCWRGSAILQQCETQSLATTELLLKGSKDHHGLRRSSTQGSGQVGMRMMRTRLSRKGLGLAVQGQVCGGGNFFTLSFLFNLLPLSTVCQPGTDQQRGLVPFSRGLAARCPEFSSLFLTKGLLAGATSSSNCSEARAARCLFSILPTKLPILRWAILIFPLNCMSLSLFVLIFACLCLCYLCHTKCSCRKYKSFYQLLKA